MELPFISTPAGSAKRGFTRAKNILGTSIFEFFKSNFQGLVLLSSHQLLFKEKHESKSPPKPSWALPAPPEGGGQRAVSLTVNSVDTEKYLQLMPCWRKPWQNSYSTENTKRWVRLLLHKHGFQMMSLYSLLVFLSCFAGVFDWLVLFMFT